MSEERESPMTMASEARKRGMRAATASKYAFSGDLTLLDIESYYKRKTRICKRCGCAEGVCECKHPEYEIKNVLRENISGKDGSSISVPYYLPKRFPIAIRKNTSTEGCVFGQSDCDYIRPEQQSINKIESRILEKLLRAGVTPVVPENTNVSVNNSVFGQVIRMKPGETMSQYGTVDTTPDISQDIAEAERLYDHSKRILGISDAFQGIGEFANESGVARSLRISQASGRLESKRKMKHTLFAELDRLIFEHYLAFADEPRELSFKDSFGRIHNAVFNKYDFLYFDWRTESFRYDDAYLFSVDLNAATSGQRETMWQKNLENLTAGTLGDPKLPSTLLRYWQCQERAHYPYARENVEYFIEMLKKGGDAENENIGRGEGESEEE